jgi:hypothetical protein
MTTQTPGATGNLKHPTPHLDAELCPMIFDKDMLHFRHLAKYVTTFWRTVCSSACSSCCRFRRYFQQPVHFHALPRSCVAAVFCARYKLGFIQCVFRSIRSRVRMEHRSGIRTMCKHSCRLVVT